MHKSSSSTEYKKSSFYLDRRSEIMADRFVRRNKKKEAVISPQDLMAASGSLTPSPSQRNQPVELGTIHYVNLTADGRHGDMEQALAVAAESGKPIFANFVEWTG
jgi:hypothetical protein